MPKRYVEKVRNDGLKKAPVGAGPYKFGSSCLSVELVLEAKRAILEKGPQRLVFKAVPDESTRLAMLKRGEADVVYSIRGGKKVKRPRASHHIKPIAQPGSRLERAMKEEARNPNYIKPTLLAPPDDDDDDVVAVSRARSPLRRRSRSSI